MKDCDPTDYMTRDEHKDLCEKSYNSIMNWAREVAITSEKDRGDLHKKVDDIKDLIPRFQWWFIGLLVAIVLASYIMPKLSRNGDVQLLLDVKKLTQEGNAVSMQNQTKIQKLEEKMGIK